MKKTLLLSLLAASTAIAATAQTEKGKFMVGAGIADLSAGIRQGGDAIDDISFSIFPRVGYFVKKNWAIGSAIGFSLLKSGSNTVINYSVQPFTRYYFGSKKTRLFAEASAGVFGYHFNDITFPGDADGTGFNFSAGPGLVHFINEHVGLETSLMFRGSSIPNTSQMQYNPSLSVGFQIYLGGHKHKAKAQDAEEDASDDKDDKNNN